MATWAILGPSSPIEGYALPTGAAQSMPLPWSNLDTIRIRFDETVEVHAEDLVVHASVGDGGAVPGRYGFASFTYADPVATWRLNRPLGNDRILLELKSAGVHDSVGNALDGEFSGRTTSGNGAPGGDFRYRFNVQPGHVTRRFQTSVTAMDTVNILRRYGSSIQSNGTATPRYWQYADINGDGRINAIDLVLARNNQRNPLPEPPPVV